MFKFEDPPNQELNKRILPQEKPYLKALVFKSKSSTLVNVQIYTIYELELKETGKIVQHLPSNPLLYSLHISLYMSGI